MHTLILSLFALQTWGEHAAYAHLHPKHVTLECRACHTLKPHENDLREVSGHATCTACHNFAEDVIRRAEAFCGECHTSTQAAKERPALFAFPKKHARRDFGIQFSHQAHRDLCTECHAPQPPESRTQMTREFNHSACFRCHGEHPKGSANRAQNPSRNDCAVCHVPGAHRTPVFPAVRDFRHADHLLDTRPRRKANSGVARPPDALCRECHRSAAESRGLADIRPPAQSTCESCHNGQPGLPERLAAQ